MSRGGAEREGDTESEAGSRLRAVSTEPDAGLKPTNCWDHDVSRSQTPNLLSHPGTPYLKKWFNLFKKIFLMFLFIFETERDRARLGEGQRERETQNRKQAPGSERSAQSPMRGSNTQTVRSWPELKSYANRLSHPGAPALYPLDPSMLLQMEILNLF